MRLRYVGSTPTTFVTVGVVADPGGEFEVPDEAAAGLLARADIEVVPASAVRRKAGRAAVPTPDAPGSTPVPDVTEEVSSGVPDDH